MSRLVMTSADGTTLSALRMGAGPPLVLVHGIAADASRWEPVLGRLAERFTVYALDRRGHGASGDAPSYSLRREAEDIAAAITAIDDDVHLFGHSFGGLVALEAATIASVRARLRSFTVYEPYVPEVAASEPSAITRSYEALAATGDGDAVVARFLREIVLATESEVTMLRAHPSWAARVASAHTLPREMAAAECHRFDASPLASVATSIPVRLLVGEASPPFLVDSVERIHRAIPGSVLVRLRGQKHVAMNTAPALFVDVVAAVL